MTMEMHPTSIAIAYLRSKVTYEMLGAVKLTEKEPKKAGLLKEGQVVKVKIAILKDDNSIKSVKCID